MSDSNAKITVELSQSEALVLFEFLSRFSEEDSLSLADPAESYVLHGLCCSLESLLVEPLKPDYHALLEKARSEVRAERTD